MRFARMPASRKFLTEKQVKHEFREYILPEIIKRYGKDDEIAIREGYNDFVDALCTDGWVSPELADQTSW